MANTLKGLYIGGQWVRTATQFDDLNPSDGSVWATAPNASLTETAMAIGAAQEAFPKWAALPFQERSHFMIKVASVIERRKND